MADRLGDLADLSTYQDDDPNVDAPGVGLGTAPQGNVAGSLAAVAGDLGQRAVDWYQRQPSWMDQMGAAQAEMDRTGDPTAMLHALGGFTGATTPRAAIRPMGAIGDVSAYQPIKAYHGSPYDFDAFDLSKIGTGEGAQAYGHGLYFAGNEATAKSYRDALAPSLGKLPDDVISLPPEMRQAVQTHAATDADAMTAAKRAQYMSAPLRTYNQSDVANMVQRVRDAKSGKMYEVNINADPSRLLNWDAPLYQQGPRAADAFKNITGMELGPPTVATGAPDAGQFIRSMGRTKGAANISAQLNEAGIPGIRYLDQGSRGSGVGTHNYVMFDPKLIDIMRKYGIAGAAGGGALYGQGDQGEMTR